MIGALSIVNVIYLTLELIIGFFLLFILVNYVRRKILNQITPFTFITAIVLGKILENALYDHKVEYFILSILYVYGGLYCLLSNTFAKNI